MDDGAAGSSAIAAIDRRIRYAMRILENEQTPLPETADVAARVGLSVFHFVRLFTGQVGLSPQDYGRDIIMRHSAGRIRYSDDPIEIVARDFGYARQATFNKAFTRHHGMPPARWRRWARAEAPAASGAGVRLERVPARRCLARRYLGPRSLASAQWADFAARLPPHLAGRPRVGFGYDDPRVTPPGRIRRDCAVEVEDGTALPAELAEDGFELLESPAGLWASATVPSDRIGDGYRAVLDGWFERRGPYALEGDPHLERHRRAPDGAAVVAVSVRVRPAGRDGDWNMRVVPPA